MLTKSLEKRKKGYEDIGIRFWTRYKNVWMILLLYLDLHAPFPTEYLFINWCQCWRRGQHFATTVEIGSSWILLLRIHTTKSVSDGIGSVLISCYIDLTKPLQHRFVASEIDRLSGSKGFCFCTFLITSIVKNVLILFLGSQRKAMVESLPGR